MYHFQKNPYIAYTQDPQKQPPKPQESILFVKPKEVDPVQKSKLEASLKLLERKSSEKVQQKGSTLGQMSLLRSMLQPREPITLSRDRLEKYSDTTLNNIINSGNKEKALRLIETEIRLTSQDAFLEKNSKEKKLAILNTLKIAVGDDMFFQTIKMQVGELLRNLGGDENRNNETFIQSVRASLRKSIHTGTVQVVKFDQENGYEVVSLGEIRRQILEDVDSTDVGPFRAFVSSGKDWKENLTKMLGPDAIAKIGLYLGGKYWHSQLINNLPNKGEIRAFFEVSANNYTKKQSELIQGVYQTLKIDGIFETKNIQANFPTLLKKIPIDKLPSLRKNPPEITELCDDLMRLKITNKKFAEYLDAFEADSQVLETRAKARRAELMKTKNRWDIGEFVQQIPGIDKAIAKRFEGKKYPMAGMSVEQMKELFVLLAPYQSVLPKALEPKMKDLFENLSIFEDVKNASRAVGGVRTAKVVAADRIVATGADALAIPLTNPEKQIIESSGKLHAAREENIFIIEHTEPTGILTNLLETLGCKDMAELSASPDKLDRAIKMLREKPERTPEEQNLLETLRGIRTNSRTIDANITMIASQSGNAKQAEKYIAAATGGNHISSNQIRETLLRERFHSEPTATKNPEEKIYLLEPGKSMNAGELPEFRSSRVSDYVITASDDGGWDRTIKNTKGESILKDVPMMAVPSVMQELNMLNTFGYESLEQHIPLINTLFSRRLEGYRIDSYDGGFGRYEMLRLVEMLTKLLYPEEVLGDAAELRNYERLYRAKAREKSTRPEWRMKEIGILNQDGALMVEKLKEILQKIN